MRTIALNLYLFDELTEEAKAIALDTCRHFRVEDDWWDSVYTDAENIGAKITSFDLGRAQHVEMKLTESVGEVAARIIRTHGKKCDTYELARDYYRERHAGLAADPNEFQYALAECYRIMLNREYEYLTGDEATAEAIRANEYEFTITGELH